jgi:uncharacterized protein (DUF58 family)
MRTREHDDSLVNLSDITEVELLILKRMREFTIGEHRSRIHGSGFDLVGLRDWQAGDRLSQVEWAQSTLTNFSPLVVRDFEQPTTAGVMVVADVSLSTRCGTNGVPIAKAIARAIATIGMSAVFFQDLFGLITFDGSFERLAGVRPRIGKGQVIHCLEAYQYGRHLQEITGHGAAGETIGGFIRKTSLVPIVSDFLFDNPREVLGQLRLLNSRHDVVVVMIDSAFAFEMPSVSAGWIDAYDVETGRTRLMSRRALASMAARVRDWQSQVEAEAKDLDFDVLRLSIDDARSDLSLMEWVIERRLRKSKG